MGVVEEAAVLCEAFDVLGDVGQHIGKEGHVFFTELLGEAHEYFYAFGAGGMAAAHLLLEVVIRYHFAAIPLFALVAGFALSRTRKYKNEKIKEYKNDG